MSYQPFPASGTPPLPTSTPAAAGRRSPVLLVIGIVVLVAGVVGGLLLILSASSSTEDSVKKLARAPAGCATTLQFDDTGEFLVYFERQGTIDELDGDCTNTGDFATDATSVPDQTLALEDSDGKTVDIDDALGSTYDAGGFKGEQIGKVTIEAAGEYQLTVTPDDPGDDSYAIAIGKDPTSNESTLRLAGIGVLALGIIVGGLLVFFGLRKRGGSSATPAAAVPGTWSASPAAAGWPPAASAPPTGGPTYGIPASGGAPTYGVPSYGSPSPDVPSASPPSYGGAPPQWGTEDPTLPQQPPDPFSRPPGS